MERYRSLATYFLTAALLTPASRAAAADCDTFTADSGNNTIIVGEVWQDLGGMVGWLPQNHLGVCWQDSTGTWIFERLTGCDILTSSSDTAHINAGAGSDTVVIHDPAYSHFYCAGLTTYHLGPWPGAGVFDFNMITELGDGYDHYYGSPNRDWGYSNTTAVSDDGDDDVLCGYGGDDILWGDATDTSDRECLSGGAGSDSCNGVTFTASDPDRAVCESPVNATSGWSSACNWVSEAAACPSTRPDLSP